MKRIVFGGIHTECSTYNPLLQTEDDFAIRSGAGMAAEMELNVPEGIEMVPLFHARSVPGGPVNAQTYAAFKARFLDELNATLPVDGVYLAMHGAMHVDGMHDAEGDWIGAVRDLVGPDVPIAVSYDLHGNVTQDIVNAIDIFAAYRTAPHIDTVETCNRALSMLADQLLNDTRHCVAWCPVPVLLPGERTSTEVEPALSLYRALPGHDLRDGIRDANLMVGYVWADTPRATACAVVTGTDQKAAECSAAQIAQSYWDARKDFQFDVPTKQLDACLDQVQTATTSPLILADSGDNPTGGGVGDRTDVLHAFLDRKFTGAVFAGIADAPAARAAEQVGEGKSVQLEIGGSLGSHCPKISVLAKVVKVIGSSSTKDLEVAVEVGGNLVILSQRRRPYHNLADFRKFGVDPAEAKLLVVKSGYLSPELAPLANPPLMALTDGAINQDIVALDNTLRATPSFPFQGNFDWTPNAQLSRRAKT
ncbi:M81 family metallopeptidase [Qingshengfaniella alkalisoli]|uniref:Microcystinase C n=1 Tax=Qingshengfaniella alkalisoli TaxID=2599296 RepID=A0A5B8J9J7_9RHOB|nr:M81 family metallopeptidase [Qingshengfaniella alkalisoli]QDY70910.1 M81 family metallopeptidase [Qingshengfaniella alkalisoli]